MALQNRNRLKSWFETGDYPTQQQFWDLMDSYFHLTEDQLPIDNIAGLRAILNAKADQEAIANHVANQSNPHNVTKAQVGLANVPNAVSDATDRNASDVLATSAAVYQLNSKISEQAGAIKAEMDNKLQTKASLDSTTGKIVISQLPDAVLGNVKFKGFYATVKDLVSSSDTAIDGQPLPTAGAANLGWYFLINEAGNYNGEAYKTGDWIISNGIAGWKKVSNADAVVSVNNKIGAVVLDKTDVGLGNADNTKDMDKPVSTAQLAALNTKADSDSVMYLFGDQWIDGIKTFTNMKIWAGGKLTFEKDAVMRHPDFGHIALAAVSVQRADNPDMSGIAIFDGSEKYKAVLSYDKLTSDRFHYLPDESGILALKSNLSGFASSEQGTWIPIIDPQNSNPDWDLDHATFSRYTRVGNVVTLTAHLNFKSKSKTSSKTRIYIKGLPFVPGVTSRHMFYNQFYEGDTVRINNYMDIDISASIMINSLDAIVTSSTFQYFNCAFSITYIIPNVLS